MTGAHIAGELLRADTTLSAIVTAGNIKLGRLPDNAMLPALLVRSISATERHMLKRVGWERVTERVSVTVRAATYAEQVEVIRLVRKCCAGWTGQALGDAERISILTAGKGPDVNGPGNSFEQAQDFSVSYDAPV